MTDLRKAAQQALEALENSSPDQYPEDAGVFYDAKEALRAALEQPNADYERGFVDGMSEQAKRSVDRAVNRCVWPCEYCGMNDENPPDHCMDCERPDGGKA